MIAKIELIFNLVLLMVELGLANNALVGEHSELYTGIFCSIVITMTILTINIVTYLKSKSKLK